MVNESRFCCLKGSETGRPSLMMASSRRRSTAPIDDNTKMASCSGRERPDLRFIRAAAISSTRRSIAKTELSSSKVAHASRKSMSAAEFSCMGRARQHLPIDIDISVLASTKSFVALSCRFCSEASTRKARLMTGFASAFNVRCTPDEGGAVFSNQTMSFCKVNGVTHPAQCQTWSAT